MVPLMNRSPLSVQAVTLGGAVGVGVGFLRARSLRWGATDEELRAFLPGDDLVPRSDVTATRAVTVRAVVADVWPWIAQLGQGRAGFYSYDFWRTSLAAISTTRTRSFPNGSPSM
jgi:hypothetical protein